MTVGLAVTMLEVASASIGASADRTGRNTVASRNKADARA
jgi:hypothetical protein